MSSIDMPPLLVFGAHPDDIEFGCGAVIANETRNGRRAHFVVCSLGESATNGSPEQRAEESKKAASILGASVEFITLDGDAHLELKVSHTVKLAQIIRRVRPSSLLAPTPTLNQHPDHARLGQVVRDAARIARYGGFKELLEQPSHLIEQLLFYAVTPDGEPKNALPILVDVSAKDVMTAWTNAMNAHSSQSASRNYVELQLTRAKLFGTRAGVDYAVALYPNEPMLITSLAQVGKGARRF